MSLIITAEAVANSGHKLFEHLPLLEEALAPYPNVRIVQSTSWQLLEGGYRYAASRISASLQARCIGGTFDRRQTRKAWFESVSRLDQVVLDVKGRRPAGWVAVDGWPSEWPAWASRDTNQPCNPVRGIGDSTALATLKVKLNQEFGG
ncbi:HAD domain-containing protein [Cupriavidus necator]|uniref:HAD domain-containing protein n=1 Tax=Cupriavidus necator TaxID=106590 RepID=UPI0013E0C0B5